MAPSYLRFLCSVAAVCVVLPLRAGAQPPPTLRSECRPLTRGDVVREVAVVGGGVAVLESGPDLARHDAQLRWLFPPELLSPSDGPADPANELRPENIGTQRLLVTERPERMWRPTRSDSLFGWRPWPGGRHRDRTWVALAAGSPFRSITRYPDGVTYAVPGGGTLWVIGPEGFRRTVGLTLDPPVPGWPPPAFAAVHGGVVGLTDPPVLIDAVTGAREWLVDLASDAVCETADGVLWGFARDSRQLVASRRGADSTPTAVQHGSLACGEREAIVLREESRLLTISIARLEGQSVASRSHVVASTAGPVLGIVPYVSSHLVWWHRDAVCRVDLAGL